MLNYCDFISALYPNVLKYFPLVNYDLKVANILCYLKNIPTFASNLKTIHYGK